jgi:TonB-dependent receptor
MSTKETMIKRKPLRMTALAVGAAHLAALYSGAVQAQTAPAAPGDKGEAGVTVVVTGQRAALQSAIDLKRNAEEIVDGVVAEDAQKLPDKSITEVLQRVVGVTMDRNARNDPEHFMVEGSGISVRGLTWGSSTLNGRESFSAGWPGRELSWGDVPSELMSAVIVHKNPPAELIEGGVSGQVDLRTALPFDYKGDKFSFSTYANYNALGKKTSPAVSALVSRRWDNSFGQWGVLLDLSANRNNEHNDSIQVDPYFARTDDAGKTTWAPKSASYRTNEYQTDRVGEYAALQWKKNGVESSLTVFNSSYKINGNEHALYTGVESPYKSVLVNPVYDGNGLLQSAKYTYPGGLGANDFAAGGLNFNVNSYDTTTSSSTREIAWNTKWTINQRLSVQNDLQWVHAKSDSSRRNMTLTTYVPSMNVDLTHGPAQITFDDAAAKFLADQGHYYPSVFAPNMEKSDGDLYAWKVDVRYKFDHPVLRDLRFGVRLTDRKSTHTDASGSNWYGTAHTWEVAQTKIPGTRPTIADNEGWKPRASFGYLSDPRYAALLPTTLFQYSNFFNGKVPAPAPLVVPAAAAINNYPDGYAVAKQIAQLQCADGNKAFNTSHDCSTQGNDWKPLSYDGDPSKTFRTSEKTQAAYLSSRFGWDDVRFPVDGSVGVRVVHTAVRAEGYAVFKPTYDGLTPPSIPRFGKIDEPIEGRHNFVDVLPSLNLRMELTDKLQARFAFAQSMYRAGFNDLAHYITLNQNYTPATADRLATLTYIGSDKGNVMLKPTRANSFDASLEWNPGSGSALTAVVFHKKVRDIILDSAMTHDYNDLAGNPQTFLITQKDNAADGTVTGLELAGQTYFNNVPGVQDWLPEWAKGFGVSANYTYIKSKQTLHHPFNLKYCPANGSFNNNSLSLYGCDTNGLPFTSMPLQYLSPNAYNLQLFYDKGPLSARLAYSWRSRFLQGVAVNGTVGSDATSADPARAVTGPDGKKLYPTDVGYGLPTWQEATGQLDFNMDYRFTPQLSSSFSVSNVTDRVVRQTQQQGIGMMGRAWFEYGRNFRLALRYSY